MSVVPTLACLGTSDDTVPDYVNRPEHLRRLCAAMGGTAHAVLVEDANHDFEGREDTVVETIAQYIEAGFTVSAALDVDHVAVVK